MTEPSYLHACYACACGNHPQHSRKRPKSRRRRALTSAFPLTALGAGAALALTATPVAPPAVTGRPSPQAAAQLVAQLTVQLTVATASQAPNSAGNGPGQVGAFGNAPSLGGPGVGTAAPIVAIAPTPTGQGYWLAGADGGVFAYGDAAFYGSAGSQHLQAPIVGIASTPSGHGYWLVGADGGVFGFGDAGYFGSAASSHLAKPIVGIAPTPTGSGYWLAAADGGVFSFGDAAFHGAVSGAALGAPIVGIARTRSGQGYWLAGADGGIFAFGDGGFHGSLAPEPAGTRVAAIAADPQSDAYWLATADSTSSDPTVQAAAFGPTGTPLGTFLVTCYDLQGRTATGVQTNSETVAVDPSVIPLGSRLYVDGAGPRIAEDTGGAIQGKRLDIWEPSYAACAAWGAQSRQVWLQG